MPEGSNNHSVRHVTIVNALGLHARAAAKFVKVAACYNAEVTVIRPDVKKDNEVSGSSIMGLMMLGAAPGCPLELRATGPAAEAAVVALADLIANRFDEQV
ncbi:MAG: HPr family phosphocarrier protein [Pseudomonadota bacterium]